MKILSLFDGISCARVALDRAGLTVTVYFASEIDKTAIAIAQRNYPETVQLGDIKTINERFDLNESFGNGIDLLIGGSPCQDLSIAKHNREGLGGGRSGLFWEYVKILQVIKPKYFVLENVASMPKEAKDTISKTLGVEPIMINAALVSAQNRKRYFWTNIPGVKLPDDKGILLKDILEDGSTTDLKAYCLTSTYYKKNARDYFLKANGQMINKGYIQMDINGKGHNSQDQRVYFTNNKMATLPSNGTQSKIKIFDKDEVRKLTPVECERLQCLPDNYTAFYTDTLTLDKLFGNVKVWNKNVVLKIAKDYQPQRLVLASNTIKDIKDINLLICQKELLKNVIIAIENQSQGDCVINIIKIGKDTKTHNIQIKLEKKQKELLQDTDINEALLTEMNTEILWKNILGENYQDLKSSITLILTKLITELKIYFSAQNQNTHYYIANLKELLGNCLEVELLDLKKENIKSISNSQRYKCLGNAFNCEVISHILKNIK